MSTLNVGTIKSDTTSPPTIRNSASTEVGTFCRAWVNFNGTGVIAIRASFNVTSLTDGGNGSYTVNFTNALSDANYSAVATITPGSALQPLVPTLAGDGSGAYSTSAIMIMTWNQTTLSANDTVRVCVAIFR